MRTSTFSRGSKIPRQMAPRPFPLASFIPTRVASGYRDHCPANKALRHFDGSQLFRFAVFPAVWRKSLNGKCLAQGNEVVKSKENFEDLKSSSEPTEKLPSGVGPFESSVSAHAAEDVWSTRRMVSLRAALRRQQDQPPLRPPTMCDNR